ncbi:hypothetical protein F2P81_017340 [Scophthalmus maximus]|uniref:Uncharacterized protein n=1 Tax=Scophthalmus maximus TaxID=52904 RepID=A0A6A4SDH5_SCOMX|nr:hypothetical protein F2P81_017340 [Scophthalmus maximus]
MTRSMNRHDHELGSVTKYRYRSFSRSYGWSADKDDGEEAGRRIQRSQLMESKTVHCLNVMCCSGNTSESSEGEEFDNPAESSTGGGVEKWREAQRRTDEKSRQESENRFLSQEGIEFQTRLEASKRLFAQGWFSILMVIAATILNGIQCLAQLLPQNDVGSVQQWGLIQRALSPDLAKCDFRFVQIIGNKVYTTINQYVNDLTEHLKRKRKHLKGFLECEIHCRLLGDPISVGISWTLDFGAFSFLLPQVGRDVSLDSRLECYTSQVRGNSTGTHEERLLDVEEVQRKESNVTTAVAVADMHHGNVSPRCQIQ